MRKRRLGELRDLIVIVQFGNVRTPTFFFEQPRRTETELWARKLKNLQSRLASLTKRCPECFMLGNTDHEYKAEYV